MNIKIIIVLTLTISGCVTTPKVPEQSMSSAYFEIKKNSFKLKAIAPIIILKEYTICKAIKFAEIKKAKKAAISSHLDWENSTKLLPKGWDEFNTIVYLSEPKETSAPFLDVKELAALCREAWSWY